MKQQERKIKPQFKIADEYLDLRTVDTNVIVDFLEEQIRLREAPLEEHAERLLRKKSKNV